VAGADQAHGEEAPGEGAAVQARGIKVLSLFFVDRVANYRDRGADGQRVKGKFAEAFEAALAELSREERFKGIAWLKEPVEKLHDGYFAQDKQGRVQGLARRHPGRRRRLRQDHEEQGAALSVDEPLRFIFSHSALREGWDNPNVFQICSLREMNSERERRQSIGRGMRLPVDQNGARVIDESVKSAASSWPTRATKTSPEDCSTSTKTTAASRSARFP
jgi:type III restriction enzyme